MFDMDGKGRINSDELYSGLKDVLGVECSPVDVENFM